MWQLLVVPGELVTTNDREEEQNIFLQKFAYT